MDYQGQQFTVFRVGDLAERVNRSSQTVAYWRRNGILPDSPFRCERGTGFDNYYTSEMMQVVVEAVEKQGAKGLKDPATFREEIVEGWRALGFEIDN
jgi:hypothetical protein